MIDMGPSEVLEALRIIGVDCLQSEVECEADKILNIFCSPELYLYYSLPKELILNEYTDDEEVNKLINNCLNEWVDKAKYFLRDSLKIKKSSYLIQLDSLIFEELKFVEFIKNNCNVDFDVSIKDKLNFNALLTIISLILNNYKAQNVYSDLNAICDLCSNGSEEIESRLRFYLIENIKTNKSIKSDLDELKNEKEINSQIQDIQLNNMKEELEAANALGSKLDFISSQYEALLTNFKYKSDEYDKILLENDLLKVQVNHLNEEFEFENKKNNLNLNSKYIIHNTNFSNLQSTFKLLKYNKLS